MHELSLLQSLLEQLDQLKVDHDLESINEVYLSVGEISGVDISFFQSTADLYLPSTPWARLILHFQELPWRIRCLDCYQEQVVIEQNNQCQQCHSQQTTTIQGREFLIQRVEGCSVENTKSEGDGISTPS